MTRVDDLMYDRTRESVDPLLPAAGAMGAYAMGLISALAWQEGSAPPYKVLEVAATCTSIEQAVELARLLIRARRRRGS